MLRRISNGWQITKASFAVLRSDPELIVFPIISMIASIIVIMTFLIPLILADLGDELIAEVGGVPILGIVVSFLFYLVMYFVVIFMNSALVGAAMIRLQGGDPTVRDGLRIASEHVGVIFGYAVLSATVGTVLKAIADRGGIIGEIAAALLGLVWSVVTFLAVPVLVMENVGPIETVKRSASLIKRTWGESLVVSTSVGMVFFLLTLLVLAAVGVPVAFLAAITESPAVIVPGVAVVVLAIIGLNLFGSALQGIYTAALYRFATEGVVTSDFSPELMQGAFQPKKKKRF